MNQPLVEHLPVFSKKLFSKTKKGLVDNGCWSWLATTDKDGYGHIIYGGKNFLAHRISFLIHNGYMPEKQVLHSCDNPQCCNPLHLKEGSNAENMRDKVLRNRQSFTPAVVGEEARNAKLTNQKVLEIRELLNKKVLQSDIANQFNISPALVSHIACRRKWKHI